MRSQATALPEGWRVVGPQDVRMGWTPKRDVLVNDAGIAVTRCLRKPCRFCASARACPRDPRPELPESEAKQIGYFCLDCGTSWRGDDGTGLPYFALGDQELGRRVDGARRHEANHDG